MTAALSRVSSAGAGDAETLAPTQRAAFDKLMVLCRASPAVGLMAQRGLGRSTILRQMASQTGMARVTRQAYRQLLRSDSATAPEMALLRGLEALLDRSEGLLLDDFRALLASIPAAGGDMIVDQITRHAARDGKSIVFVAAEPRANDALFPVFRDERLPTVLLDRLEPRDYVSIISGIIGQRSANVDFDRIHRAAPLLTCYDLSFIARLAVGTGRVSTEGLLDIIGEHVLHANTRTGEVEGVSFETMPGSEAIAEALDTHVLLPMTRPDLAEELDLRAKRGVLLYGPPGTGKTSVGRALAHRMEGRFFLIDGSINTEPNYAFFPRVLSVIRQAIENSPSVLFIDDADVLFGIPHVAGLPRYLLSLLDGMVSESASRLCLMMTAMDPSRIPPAILRSGRVELWLETRLPDAATRGAIIARWAAGRLPGIETVDMAPIAERTEGFTPADLRRIVNDAASYYAQGRAAGEPIAGAQTYLGRAVDALVDTRAHMARALGDPSLRVGTMGGEGARARLG